MCIIETIREKSRVAENPGARERRTQEGSSGRAKRDPTESQVFERSWAKHDPTQFQTFERIWAKSDPTRLQIRKPFPFFVATFRKSCIECDDSRRKRCLARPCRRHYREIHENILREEHSTNGKWHFLRHTEDIRSYTGGASKVVGKLVQQKSKLSFMWICCKSLFSFIEYPWNTTWILLFIWSMNLIISV